MADAGIRGDENPFSPEKAYAVYLNNMEEAARLREEIRQDMASDGVSERELLLKTVSALGKLTDNTILEKIVRRSLEERDSR